MRVCKNGCHVTLSVFPAQFETISKPIVKTLKYKYAIQMKKTFLCFDLGIDHLFPSDPCKESNRKNNNSALHASMLAS